MTMTSLPDSASAKFCDTLDIDQENHLLYAGDNWSGGVDVFDISTPKADYVRTIRILGVIFGVVVAKNVEKLFVGLSGSQLAVVDTNATSDRANTEIARLYTGGMSHTDLLDYDPVNKKVYAASRNDGFMITVDASTNEIVGRVEGLGPGLEQPRYNSRDGMVYLTSDRGNALLQIDPAENRLVKRFEIPDACYPKGLAINAALNRALIACGNKERSHTVIWDLNEHKILSIIEEAGSGDGAIYDATIDRFFFAAHDYRGGPVIGIYGGDPVRFLAKVHTNRAAGWVAYDRTHRVVYAPAIQNGKPALLSFVLPDV